MGEDNCDSGAREVGWCRIWDGVVIPGDGYGCERLGMMS